MSIVVENISKRFGNFLALDKVSHDFHSGELTALLGPSGSGKTSLLRIIAGLDFADEGRVLFEGEDATDRHARHRRVGFVFQHYALFRHMTVRENIAFGLRVKPRAVRPSRADIHDRVRRLLQLIQLDWLGDRFPHQLSGGQRQRVALARALAVEPKVLLLDEPFGALDANVRKELRIWLRRLHDEIHVTSIFVTHDVEEALEVADRIVVLNNGRIEQSGAPDHVYEHPATPFVYNFLGASNVLDSYAEAETGGGTTVLARPHDLEILPDGSAEGAISAKVLDVRTVGSIARVMLERLDTNKVVHAEVSKHVVAALNLSKGQTVLVRARHLQEFRT